MAISLSKNKFVNSICNAHGKTTAAVGQDAKQEKCPKPGLDVESAWPAMGKEVTFGREKSSSHPHSQTLVIERNIAREEHFSCSHTAPDPELFTLSWPGGRGKAASSFCLSP